MSEGSTPQARGSQARMPDLDWSQVRETVLMLELAAGQVEAALRESNSSVEVLAGSFTSMAGTLEAIDRRYRPDAWAELQELIASKFTMVEERAMFDAVLNGVPVKAALEQYVTARMQEVEASGGDIELF